MAELGVAFFIERYITIWYEKVDVRERARSYVCLEIKNLAEKVPQEIVAIKHNKNLAQATNTVRVCMCTNCQLNKKINSSTKANNIYNKSCSQSDNNRTKK